MKLESENDRLAIWRKLYDAALVFVKQASWKWMENEDVFGFQDPDTKEYVLCSILGNGGVNYGFTIYPGPKGTQTLLKILDHDEEFIQDPISHIDMRAIVMDLGESGYIQQENLDIIKMLGLSFKGDGWISFRSHLPGLVPGLPTTEEARLMTLALEQAVIVAEQKKANPEFVTYDQKKGFLCRQLKNDVWQNSHYGFPVDSSEEEEEDDSPLNEVKIRLVREKAAILKGDAEADLFYLPTPVRGVKGTPDYYPLSMMMIDTESKFVLCMAPSEPGPGQIDVFRNAFLDACLKYGTLPSSVIVNKLKLAAILGPVLEKLGVKMMVVQELDFLPEIRKDVFNQITSGGSIRKREERRAGRNDPCPCGSGRKYKKCCGKDAG